MSSRQDARPPRDPSHPHPLSSSHASLNGSQSARKRSSRERAPEAGPSEPLPKRSKGKGRQTAFNPIPVRQAAGGDGDGDDHDVPIPPPPRSVKATASERMKDKAALMASPAPRRGRGRTSAEDYPEDEGEFSAASRPEPRTLFGSKPVQPAPSLNFRKVAKPRASMAPPPSPAPSTYHGAKRPPRRSMRPEEVLNDHVVPLPPMDTPVIERNRHLREKSRRESLGKRGGRGTSSFDRGEPSYPHRSISHTQFHKHFPPERPEPQKAAWLISWCGKRAFEERTDTSTSRGRERARNSETAELDQLLGNVMDDFCFKLAQGKVDTNVFAPPGEEISAMPIKPHPKNVENRKAQAKENAVIKRMKEEELAWGHVTSGTNRGMNETITSLKANYRPGVLPEVDEADDAGAWFQRALQIADEVLASGDDVVGSAADFGQVEFEIDTLHHASHRANRYAQQSKQFLDGIFTSLAADLRAREGTSTLPPTDSDSPDTATVLATATGAGGAPLDPMSMLRALASADAKNPSAEALSRVQTMGAPRQATVATPRRQAIPRRSVYGRGTPAAGR